MSTFINNHNYEELGKEYNSDSHGQRQHSDLFLPRFNKATRPDQSEEKTSNLWHLLVLSATWSAAHWVISLFQYMNAFYS